MRAPTKRGRAIPLMVGAPARRQQVAYASARGLSQRRACALLHTARSYVSTKAQADAPIIARMCELAGQYPRYGYRRIRVFLGRDGHRMGSDRAHRLWRGAPLQVPRKRPRRRVAGARPKPARATGANQVSAYDFVFDACANGQQLKCLTVIDEYTREALAIDVAGSIRSDRVIEVLTRLISVHGPRALPERQRSRVRVAGDPPLVDGQRTTGSSKSPTTTRTWDFGSCRRIASGWEPEEEGLHYQDRRGGRSPSTSAATAVDALLAALPAHLQPPTRFAYLSAWRRAEVLGLTWARVTFDADGGGSIRLDAAQSKNGSGRVLPFVAGPRWLSSSPSDASIAASTVCTSSTGTGNRSATSTTHGARRASPSGAQICCSTTCAAAQSATRCGPAFPSTSHAPERAQDGQHLPPLRHRQRD